jgi:transposase
MRFIKNLPYETQSLLERIYAKSKKHETREKAQCILLSYRGFTINKLFLIFNVHLNTIYNWFNEWENKGILSLYTEKGQGRKSLLDDTKSQEIKKLIIENPKQVKKVISKIKDEYEITLSERTLKRYLKKTKICMEKNT